MAISDIELLIHQMDSIIQEERTKDPVKLEKTRKCLSALLKKRYRMHRMSNQQINEYLNPPKKYDSVQPVVNTRQSSLLAF